MQNDRADKAFERQHMAIIPVQCNDMKSQRAVSRLVPIHIRNTYRRHDG